MKAFICILIISISLYTILKMYIEYGNIFSIVSATVGVTLLCLSTTSTDNRSIEMKKK